MSIAEFTLFTYSTTIQWPFQSSLESLHHARISTLEQWSTTWSSRISSVQLKLNMPTCNDKKSGGYSNCTSNSSGVFSEAARLDIQRMTTSKCFSCLSAPAEAAHLIEKSDGCVSCCHITDTFVLITVELDRCRV